ncbi:hypothetical protein L6R52_15145 [Myxococcota bacterium]|nr:hypothetical protein [Myxococcota bacterium]
MRERRAHTLLVVASILTLVALGLIVTSLLVPRPLPVILAMSLGQVIGTCAFALYLVVIIADLRSRRVFSGERRG